MATSSSDWGGAHGRIIVSVVLSVILVNLLISAVGSSPVHPSTLMQSRSSTLKDVKRALAAESSMEQEHRSAERTRRSLFINYLKELSSSEAVTDAYTTDQEALYDILKTRRALHELKAREAAVDDAETLLNEKGDVLFKKELPTGFPDEYDVAIDEEGGEELPTTEDYWSDKEGFATAEDFYVETEKLPTAEYYYTEEEGLESTEDYSLKEEELATTEDYTLETEASSVDTDISDDVTNTLKSQQAEPDTRMQVQDKDKRSHHQHYCNYTEFMNNCHEGLLLNNKTSHLKFLLNQLSILMQIVEHVERNVSSHIGSIETSVEDDQCVRTLIDDLENLNNDLENDQVQEVLYKLTCHLELTKKHQMDQSQLDKYHEAMDDLIKGSSVSISETLCHLKQLAPPDRDFSHHINRTSCFNVTVHRRRNRDKHLLNALQKILDNLHSFA